MATAMADKLMLKLLETLNEAQARWFVAREAIARGRGGIQQLHEVTGMSRPTITRGIGELKQSKRLPPNSRIRKPGGGRKRLEHDDPGLTKALQRIMDENSAGDPMSLLRWTNKSTERIAEELTRQGHTISDETVRRRLSEMGYSLQVNAKTLEGKTPPERDAQFRYINRQVKKQLAHSEPVLSIDTKKKELVGAFKRKGKTYRPKGKPYQVNVSDYPNLAEGPAIPYGAYDMGRNEGFVNVGMTHDTAKFAIESLRRWWRLVGRRHYPKAKSLLLCADGGGSNSSRSRAWKYHVQRFADESRLEVRVCHYPPGTSKWNKIEHRMFSHISMNWQGRPLISYETVVNLIGSTRTKTGLRVKAKLDRKFYATGEKISDEQMEEVNIRPHPTHPKWNYTISPTRRRQRSKT